MQKLEKHSDLVALTQMPPAVLSPEDIRELQKQLRLRLDMELAAAKDEAVRDLLDLSSDELRLCSSAALAVVRAQWEDGADTVSAEEAYFTPGVLEVYLPGYLLDD